MGRIELKAKGLSVIVHRDGQPIGRVWWSAARERYIAAAMSGPPIGEHPLRTTAIRMVIDSATGISRETSMYATVADITDEIAQQVADAIGERFGATPGYAPKVMDADWDCGSGRVIVWEECPVPDWAILAGPGGMSEYGGAIEYAPVQLPSGVWVEPVNPMTLRVMLSHR
ncbi:hypothetical protein [Nonomuraea sp. NPDC049784]|uniref:hypothetical protein n=1 Tax=Nonomuraea sp. NPDC049784 TaxID=3154361 RepID=UPI0033EA3B4B